MNEHEKAKQNIPEGYEVVTDGEVQDGDLVWNWLLKTFQPNHVENLSVESFTCVIRPIKPETKETF